MTAELRHITARAMELANKLSGGREVPGLEELCLAAVRAYSGRLKPGVTISSCAPALIAACANTALSGLAAREGAVSGEVSSFRIGEVSVSAGGAGKTGGAQRAETLRDEAERLMAPYIRAKEFAFVTA